MKTVAIINQRGGVGKSTTAQALQAGLLRSGASVLLIDTDPQGNTTYTAGARQNGAILSLLQGDSAAASEAIQKAPGGDIIASSAALTGADATITGTGKEYRLKEALETIAGQYDFCIIDAPPALGVLTVNALTASSGAIIPTQADIYSLQGIGQLSQTIDTVRKYCNSGLAIYGILLTRYNGRTIISKEIADTLERKAQELNTKLYSSKIRECTAIKEAQALKQSIFEYAPRSNAAKDYGAFVCEFLQDIRKKG